METICYGKFQEFLTLCIKCTKAVPAVRIAEHTSGRDDTTIPVTCWNEYLNGWDLGNTAWNWS